MHSVIQNIPRLIRTVALLTLSNLAIFAILRLAFWLIFHSPDDPAPAGDLFMAFYLGTKFDLQLTLVMISPVFVFAGIPWLSPFRSRVFQYFWIAYLVLAMVTVLFVYAIDFGHYAYLNRRIDATVLRFLENFDISMQMVWQTYHVIGWSLVILAAVLAYIWWVARIFSRLAQQPTPSLTWRGKLLAGVLSTLILLLGIYGSYTYPYVNLTIIFLLLLAGLQSIRTTLFGRLGNWSLNVKTLATVLCIAGVTALSGVIISRTFGFEYYPLRWSAAFFTNHNFSSSVASNPIIYFANTLKNRNISFDVAKTRQYYPVIRDFLQPDKPDETALTYRRHIKHTPAITTRPNIVMVFLESFAGYKTSAFHNPLDPTPEFNKLANNGVLFTHYFSPLTGTARSVFAAVTGLPDIEVHKTATRNPLIINQHTIINAYHGYEKFYFIGGSASWGNIRGLLSFNIPNLHLYEEDSYTSPRMDVWGIDDLHLFIEANQVLRKQDKPFFAIIQTAGNHRPYNIPLDNYGFKRDDQTQAVLEKNGFINNDEYNSFRFMDHSIGTFIKTAQKEKYFENTVFVFYGDHGITGYGGAHTPEYMGQHELTGLHVPMLIYAPKLLKPQRIDKLASEVDLLPTIAGLTLGEFTNTTLGRDLFDKRYDNQHAAFTMMDRTIGLLSGNYYYRYNPATKKQALYDLQGSNPLLDVAGQHPADTARLEALCTGIYETTKYMMYHNPNEAIATVGSQP